jgi:ketosteroid isomerase-like protein
VAESAEPARLVNTRRFFMGMTGDGAHDGLSLLSPDVVYTVPGRSPLAGVFRGPAEVREHCAKLLGATARTFEVLKWIDWLVGSTHIAALQLAQAQGGGMIYRNHHIYVVETDRQDLLTKIHIYFENQAEADGFFSSLPLV